MKDSNLALSEGEQYYRLLVEQSPNTVAIHSEGKIVYINPAGIRLFGATSEKEILGKPAIDFVHPDDREEVVNRIAKSMHEGKPAPLFEERFLLPDGNIIYVDVLGIPITYQGKPAMEVILRDITDRKAAEKALRASDARLSSFLEYMPALILIKDRELRPIFANNKFYQNFPVDQWLGKKPHELFPKEIADEMVEKDMEALTKGYTAYQEVWQDLPGKTHIYFTEKFRIDIPDEPPLLGSIITDITEKKKVEQALLENEEIFSQFLERSPIYVFFKDDQIRSLRLSRNFEEFLGKPMEELIGKNMYDLFPSDFAKKMVEDDIQVLNDGKEVVLEEEFNGRYFTTIKFPINISGKPRFLAGFTIDITEKKQAEEKLRESETLFRKLSHSLEQSPAAIVITDINGIIEYVNPRFSLMTGYPIERVLGKVARILKPGRTSPEMHEQIWQSILGGKDWKGEYMSKKITGESYWESVSVAPIFDSQLRIMNIIITMEDISERKKMITELINARKKAEESDRLKSAFLANMSHEIRTPMNAIVGFAEMLADPTLSEEERARFSQIVQSRSDDLMHIINDLLEISRIESGNVTIVKKEIMINEILDDLETIFNRRLQKSQKSNLSLQTVKAWPDDRSIIVTDAYILKQVFSNLIENAIKYTPSGLIRFGYNLPENGTITFFVNDPGIGISIENQSVIFEHFRQADVENPHQYSGSGLGLAICKGAIELLNGRIWVDSELGKGSSFMFMLPNEQKEPGYERVVSPVRQKLQKRTSEISYFWPDKKILIVEDEPTNMEFLRIILKRSAIQIISVESGALLRKQYENLDQFDLILLDVRLPDANGWDLAKEIKALKPELPIIAQTAYAMSTDLEKSRASGCDNYISKPINKEKLMKMISEYLAERNQ